VYTIYIKKIIYISASKSSNVVLKSSFDFIFPCSFKISRALALIYWLLAREILKEHGKIKSNDDFNTTLEDFEAEI
jgi:small subunit ribosomal protein S2